MKYSFLIVVALVLFLFPGAAKALDSTQFLKAIEKLESYPLSLKAKQNISTYVNQSTNAVVRQGLHRLLEHKRQAEFLKLKRAAKRIRIDGKSGDWSTSNFEVKDKWNDWYPINSKKKIRKKRKQFDLVSYGFVVDDRYLYAMIKPRTMPKREKYYLGINIMGSGGGLYMWSLD